MNFKEILSLKGHQDESSRYIAFFVRILVIYLIWFSFRELMEKSLLLFYVQGLGLVLNLLDELLLLVLGPRGWELGRDRAPGVLRIDL